MLSELAVTNLGVIERAHVTLGPQMTAFTGETGAGKTMIVQALGLLCGARADSSAVRAGCDEAVVEGRLQLPRDRLPSDLPGAAPNEADVVSDDPNDTPTAEVVVRRVVPASGPSRAFINGQMASAAQLTELGSTWCDLHGQHQHQSLLVTSRQRDALDAFAAVDLAPLTEARRQVAATERGLAELGGDSRDRAHQVDLLRYQVREIDDADVQSADEIETLARREQLLAQATQLITTGETARQHLSGDEAAIDNVSRAAGLLGDGEPFGHLADRLRTVEAELVDLAAELRTAVETIDSDPAALEATSTRLMLLRELTRKYGDTLADVLAYRDGAADRLHRLEQHDTLAAGLEAQLETACAAEQQAAEQVAAARQAAAPLLAQAVGEQLRPLALDGAAFHVTVGDQPPGDDVEMLFSANRGQQPGPLRKVASGGELARAMLALRLVLTAGPPTLVFDEVDAGVGGQAAVAVGRALAQLAPQHQVLIVTHLPQVAAFADHQVVVEKNDDGVTVASDVTTLSAEERVAELTRMLAGRPDSASGRQHAAELLAAAATEGA